MTIILFLAANPADMDRNRTSEEIQQIREQIQKSVGRKNFICYDYSEIRGIDMSQAMLDHNPHILHFSGHGLGQDGICLEDAVGKSQPISAGTLSQLFQLFTNTLKCVVLNACYSKEQAAVIRQHVDFVVGMNDAILDGAGIAYSSGFYQALGAGESVQRAHDFGKAQIGLQGGDQAPVPVLYVRPGANIDAPFGSAKTIPTLPQPNRHFTGRDDELQALRNALTSGGNAAVTQAIAGLGGVGKTSLAVAYAHNYAFYYNRIFYTSAESVAALNSGYRAIAAQMGGAFPADTPDDTVRDAVKAALESMKPTNDDAAPFLLVMDNADFGTNLSPKDLLRFLPGAHHGHILLTTRTAVLDISLGVAANRVLTLGVWDEAKSVAFLTARIKGEGATLAGDDADAARELAQLCGGLPLALEQAAAYIRNNGSAFRNYVNLFKKRAIEMLERAAPEAGDYGRTLGTTWLISFDAVAAINPASADLLRLCAFVAPENIPVEVVFGAAEGAVPSLAAHFGNLDNADMNEDACNRLLEPLTRYSLVTRDAATATFFIHRLVQAVQIALMDTATRTKWTTAVLNALDQAFPIPEFETWTICERLTPHVQALLKHTHTGKYDANALSRILNDTAAYLEIRARYGEAEELLDEVLVILHAVLPKGHPDIATALNNLAELYGRTGRNDTAIKLLEKSLANERAALPEGHPNIVISLNNIAGLYARAERRTEAFFLYKEALTIFRDASSQDYPLFALVLNNLANLYSEMGQDDNALPLYKNALTIRRANLQPDHLDVAYSMSGLAALYYRRSQYDDALPLLEEALKIFTASLGEGHPDTELVRGNVEIFRMDMALRGVGLTRDEAMAMPPDELGKRLGR